MIQAARKCSSKSVPGETDHSERRTRCATQNSATQIWWSQKSLWAHGESAAPAGATIQRILDAIRSAVESGINFIDTAPAYNGGVAESYVGKVISSMRIRKELYLVTKCGTEFIDVKWFAMSKNKYYNSKDEASKML